MKRQRNSHKMFALNTYKCMRPCHTYSKRSFILAMRIHEVSELQQQAQLLLISSCACERIKNPFFSISWSGVAASLVKKIYGRNGCMLLYQCLSTNVNPLIMQTFSFKRGWLCGQIAPWDGCLNISYRYCIGASFFSTH